MLQLIDAVIDIGHSEMMCCDSSSSRFKAALNSTSNVLAIRGSYIVCPSRSAWARAMRRNEGVAMI